MSEHRGAERTIFLIDAHLLDTLIAAVALETRHAALVHTAPQQQPATASAPGRSGSMTYSPWRASSARPNIAGPPARS